MTIRSGIRRIVVAAALAAAPIILSPAKAAIIFESAQLIAEGNVPSLGAGVAIGTRFSISETVQVDMIGAHFRVSDTGTYFGAIVPLASPFSNPSGSVQEIALASTTFTIPTDPMNPLFTVDFLTPLSVILAPGDYGVVFGRGLFGTTAADGPLLAHNNSNPCCATYFFTSDHMNWFSGQTNPQSPNSFPRMVVTGSVIAIPTPGSLSLFGLGLLALGHVRRRLA